MKLCCLLLLKSGQKSKNSPHHGDAVFEKNVAFLTAEPGLLLQITEKTKQRITSLFERKWVEQEDGT